MLLRYAYLLLLVHWGDLKSEGGLFVGCLRSLFVIEVAETVCGEVFSKESFVLLVHATCC